MAGTLVIDTLTDGSGNSTSATNPIRGSAKAWVRFTGASATINASYNISSMTRNATGDYTINLTSGIADTNGVIAGTCGVYGTSYGAVTQTSFTSTTQFKIVTMNWSGNAPTDYANVSVAVFR